MRPFLNESGVLTREGFHQFSAHMREKCLAQLNDTPKAA